MSSLYICPNCLRNFDTTGDFRRHTSHNATGCFGEKITRRSDYYNPVLRLNGTAVEANLPMGGSLAPHSRSTDSTTHSLLGPITNQTEFPFNSNYIPCINSNQFPLITNTGLHSPHPFGELPSMIFDQNSARTGLTPQGNRNEEQIGPDCGLSMYDNPWAESIDTPCNSIFDASYAGLNETQPEASTNQAPGVPPFPPVNLPYIRIVSKGRIIFRHPTAGRSYGKGRTRWELERERNKEERGGNKWAMWGSQDEWESAKWMASTKVSQSSLDKLMKTKRYRHANYSFKTAKQLFKKIETEMDGFGGPKWHAEDVMLPDAPKDKITLFYRDLQECADFQFGRPWFAGKMAFAPERQYEHDGSTRLYENPWTGEYWNEQQDLLPPGTTLGGVLFASDATQLSMHSGDVAAHAVYMSLANLDKSTRANTTENGWILVAYIPKSKFHSTVATFANRPKSVRRQLLGLLNRRLFHRCMEIITRPLRRTEPHDTIDPEGNIRSVIYKLVGYIADLEEQWMIAGIGTSTCPHCVCDAANLGGDDTGPPRTPQGILDTLQDIKRNYRAAWKRPPSLEEFLHLAGSHKLNGVDKPFWRLLPNFNIFNTLSPDLLHGFHKMFYDHIFQFNLRGLGQDEYDARIKSQVHFTGDRAFLHGISHISQMTGIEHRMLERHHLSIVANGAGNITDQVTRATRAAMECTYLAQLPTQSDRSLKAYQEAYKSFMADRWGWVHNGTRCGKNGVIKHFNIPKMHVIRHFDEHVRLKGSADNYSTETMEHLHIDLVKDAYRASNRREWKTQTARWLTRREKIRDFEAWMRWCEDMDKQEDGRERVVRGPCESHRGTCEGIRVPEDRGIINGRTDGLAGPNDGSPNDGSPSRHSTGSRASREEGTGVEGDEDSEGVPCLGSEDTGMYGERVFGKEAHQHRSGPSAELVAGTNPIHLPSSQHISASYGKESLKRKRPESPEIESRHQPRLRVSETQRFGLQTVNQSPSVQRTSIETVCELYGLDLQQMLHEVDQNPYFASLPITVDQYTLIDTWYSIWVNPASNSSNSRPKSQRIWSKPMLSGHAARNDPVFYIQPHATLLPTARLLDCAVGQFRLLFRLSPTTLVPNPPLMAFIRAFTPIPRSVRKITGLRAISKTEGTWKHRIILASQVLRQCPLAPIIRGRARRDVDADTVLEEYSEFYLNKYRSVDDYIFMTPGLVCT